MSSRGERAAGQEATEGGSPTGSNNSPVGNHATPAPHADEPAAPFSDDEIGEPGAGDEGVLTTLRGPEGTETSLAKKIKTVVVGKPRDLRDQSVFQHVSLIAFLAWVGLGADGLSSSCYGPPEAFQNLNTHYYLAVFLALATMMTVLVISRCYSHIIEEFPSGGGGYLVASKLLGRPAGVVSGSALLVDYVLTITVSIAAAGDALYGLFGPYVRSLVEYLHEFKMLGWLPTPHDNLKLYCELVAIIVMIVLNLRGVRESVKMLLPVFLLFLATHALLIAGSVLLHLTAVGDVAREVTAQVREGLAEPGFGFWGMLALLLRAYSLGAGTYTGIEAVSNSMPVMREPRVATAKRTMLYMACSLAFMAGGLMLAYLLLGITPGVEGGKTLNQVLTEKFLGNIGLSTDGLGGVLLWATMISEGALLYAAAQAGFIDGPRVLANMAHDSFMPHWFANLSERLATHNGILLMGVAAISALLYTDGKVERLVIMYSINVFLTFSLSMIGMSRLWWQRRGHDAAWRQRLSLFVFGAVLCLAILCVTVYEKFEEGGYVTLGVTLVLVGLCFGTRRYYRGVVRRLKRLDASLGNITATGNPNLVEPDANQPTAAILVGGYGGLGVHTMLNAVRFAPGYFKNFVFLSVGVVDSGNFKGAGAVEDLQQHTAGSLASYVDLAQRLGMPSTSFMSVGTDAVDELEQLCLEIAKRFPKVVFFAGQLVFNRDTWWQRLFHNQTAYSLQRRLQWDGVPMVILPTRVK
ncbi:MAG TPA: APC family permease [Pirellulales bacterium]|jgi:amino acid transporter|nr:APC family permease [Pirellulales bacterium]